MLNSRQNKIFDLLQQEGKISVSTLAKTLFVSEMTVRRDLKLMEKNGLLIRCRGGAIYSNDKNMLPVSARFHIEEKEKRRLALLASKYLHDNMSVYIDSSSTCMYLIWHLTKFRGITLFTNSVNALQTASKLEIPTFLIGGEYNSADMCCVGAFADSAASTINTDVAFFSSAGLSHDGIISDSDILQTSVRKIIMKNSDKNIFLFEKNKIGKKFIFTLCKTDEVADVIVL